MGFYGCEGAIGASGGLDKFLFAGMLRPLIANFRFDLPGTDAALETGAAF
jgi:hypothetical protein